MSAQLTIGMWVEWVRAGVASYLGRADAAYQHSDGTEAFFTTTGAVPGIKRTASCAAGVETVLWDYTDDPITIEFAVANSSVIGFLVLYVDDETSSTNAAASGNYQHKYYLGMGCCKPQTITTYTALTKATASDPSGQGQDPATLTVGRVYKIAFYNPNSDAGEVDFQAFT